MNVDRPVEKGSPADDADSATPAPTAGVQSCARCGLPLAADRPQDGCPRCALRLVLDADEDDPPLVAGGTTRADTPLLRYGHFEVALGSDGRAAELGSGTMGTTYRALDTVLRLPVALKVISNRVAGHPVGCARFLREARAAARLHHPNVASVTFYGEQDGECFYSMELVEGETLAERVERRGPLPPEQALEVGVQVARALAAAEAHGLVHRDLKPSNLMLVGALEAETPLHVKVIDWGLTKAVGTDDDVLGANDTRHAFVGTPAFASPEQFAHATGEQRVDTRSDIYSLGVTLWTLLCGKTPFVGDTLATIHARQRTLPTEQLRSANVPAYLAKALRSMVAFDPAARPQSARELLDVLRRCQQELTRKTSRTGWRKRSRQLVGVGLLLVLGTGVVVWRGRHTAPVPAAQAGSGKYALAVLPFENQGGDQDNEFFARSVQGELTRDLTHLTAFDVIGAASTRDDLPGPNRDLDRIGQDLDARYLLEGSVRRQDKQVQISVRLHDLRDPEHPWNSQFTQRSDEAYIVPGQIIRALAEHLRVTLSDREKSAVEGPPTSDLTAYNLYLRGKDDGRIFQTVEQECRYRSETSVPMLEQAVKRDPQFALAYTELVNNFLHLLTYESLAGNNDALAAHSNQAEAALMQATRICPDTGETHLARASILYTLHDDYEGALAELELARRAMPSNVDVEVEASFLVSNLGRLEEGTRYLERALRLEPHDANRRFSLALTYRLQRRFEQSDREIARVIAATPRNASLSYRGFRAIGKLEERGDITPLRELYASVTPEDAALPEVVTRAHLVIALYSHDAEGATRAAAEVSPGGLQWGEFPLPKAWFEALAARLRHDDAAAHDSFLRARADVEKSMAGDPQNGYLLSVLAMIDAGLGDKDKALDEAQRVSLSMREQSAPLAPVMAYQVAVTYAWMDRPDLACQTLEPWVDRPAGQSAVKIPNYGDFRLNPVWDPLQGNPRFVALTAKFAPKSK